MNDEQLRELAHTLAPKARHIMTHSLGLNMQPEAYRNHFCTDPDSPDGLIIEGLIERGLMVDRGSMGELSGGMHVYQVTYLGREVVTYAS